MATSNTTPKTIVLTARGLESDVRLHVLNYTIFHVYSVVLKMNSAFFFKFLDSAEKTTLQAVTAPISGRFKHDWVTKVDDDGTWSLIAATDGKNIAKFKGDSESNVKTFEAFLQALYAKPWDIPDIASLQLLIDFADYYCALPVISRSLSNVLLHGTIRSAIRFWNVSQLPTLLNLSYKLRHRELFSDSVVAMAGKREDFRHTWRSPVTWNMHHEILRCISKVSEEIDTIVSRVHQSVMGQFSDNVTIRRVLAEITQFDSLPEYYGNLFEQESEGDNFGIREAIKPMLSKNLVLDPSEDEPGRDGFYLDFFLCGRLEETDLPWDPTQEDW